MKTNCQPEFVPHPFFRNPHSMTLIPRYWPRPGLLRDVPQENRLFHVDQESRVLVVCHWQGQPRSHPTLILVHGLEGCSESHYMRGLAHKAWQTGFNVARMNQRNCGGTEHLTPTLYNSGLSQDIRNIVIELEKHDALHAIWVVGYSMGGNLALRLAGEQGQVPSTLKGIAAVCPNIHPAACVEALERPGNWLYHQYFLSSLKARLRRKAKHFPGKFDLSLLPSITTLTEFDDAYTAPFGGYQNAADYYERVGARHILSNITIPTLLITAQDDPFIPYRTFDHPALETNPSIHFHAPTHGGHCGFLQSRLPSEDRFWVENRIMDFLLDRKMKAEVPIPLAAQTD